MKKLKMTSGSQAKNSDKQIQHLLHDVLGGHPIAIIMVGVLYKDLTLEELVEKLDSN